MQFSDAREPSIDVALAAIYFAAVLVSCYHSPGIASSQNVLYVHDGINLPAHRLRGETRARADLKTGAVKLYVPVCTFPSEDRRPVRQYEIRKALYRDVGINVMADLCNDILPNASQQEAFVAGYNSVMDLHIAKQLGKGWEKSIDQQVRTELRRNPRGTLRAKDIEFETPY